MDAAVAARVKLNETSKVKISFNDLVLKATAVALKQHPKVNSSWLGDKIRYNHHINIGVAVAVEEGLLVPVVRFADGLSLSQIALQVKDYAQKAKDKCGVRLPCYAVLTPSPPLAPHRPAAATRWTAAASCTSTACRAA